MAGEFLACNSIALQVKDCFEEQFPMQGRGGYYDFKSICNKKRLCIQQAHIVQIILPKDNNIQNDQRQDWKDDVEHGVKSQNIDIDVPKICPG